LGNFEKQESGLRSVYFGSAVPSDGDLGQSTALVSSATGESAAMKPGAGKYEFNSSRFRG